MIFKTITDETTLSGQRIVGALQARKIAQEQAIKQTNLDIQCLRNYENACKNGTVSSADFTRIMGKASTQAQEYSKNIKEGTGSAQIYADKQKALQQSIQNTGVASKVAAVGVKALSIAGNMLAGMAIAFVFSKIIEGINYLATASKRAIEKTKELQQEISKISSDYQSERQTLEGLRKEYDALTSKIGENGAEASLSADEYERYRDITSEILGITPKLITGWDEEGRAISNKNGLLQQSIDLLDEEYQKSLRNSTTKSKNEEIAAGIIEQKKNFDNSGDTKTVAGTKYDLKSNLWDYIKKAVAEKKINYTYSTGIVGKNDADAAYAINEFVYGDSLYKSTKMRYGDDSAWLKSLMERITSSQENFEKFANSLSNKDNPIYQWFTDEQIDELIRGADEYFQELARIESEEQQYFQQYKDQLNLNAQAVGDAYSDLDEQTKAGIVQMIDSFDYNNMTKEKFSDMATDLKDFVGKLSTDDILISYFNNLFKPMGDDESIEDYETRVKTGIDEITSYCKSNYPAIKLSFGDVEKDVEDLKLKYNTAISKFTGDANDVDLGQFFRDNSINDEYEIDYWNKVTEGAKTASEAVEMYNNVKCDTFNDKNTISFSDIFSLKSADDTLTNLGKISESIDTIQNAYKTLSDAIDEYNDEGAFSIDTLQSVISLGDDWLDYLVDEEGKLKLDKESLEQLTLSRLNDMRVQAINNVIDNVSKIKDETSAYEYLASTNYALADSYEAVGKASLETARMQMQAAVAAGTLSQENMDAAMSKAYADIEKINKLFNNTDFSAKSITGGSGSSKSSKSSSSSSSEFEETVDFFDRRIKVLDDSISHLKTSLENVSGSFGKNNLIDAELNITGEKFRNYTDALSMYTKKANEALSKLPADIAAKVKDGAVALTDFVGDGNKDVVEAIKDYESWAGKVNDCKQELAELRTTIRQLELEKFNNIVSDFTDQFDLRNNSKELISKQVDLLKESGQLIGESFFTAQIDQSKKQLELLENEKAQLINQMTDAVSSGRVNCCPLLQ